MDNLLPPNATPLERNMAEVMASLGNLPVPLPHLLRPDTCPSAFLPWLGDVVSVDSWDMNWSDAQKRDTIKASLGIHRMKGTIGGVRRALAAIGYGVRVQEWFNQVPPGPPYTYRLLLESSQIGITKAALENIAKVIDATKNLRSHLDVIVPSAASMAVLTLGSVASSGNEITLQFNAPLIISETTLAG